MGEELDDLWAADRSRKQAEVEVPPRHPRHRRQHLPVEVILQHRRLSPWRPSAAAVRALAQSAFVDEDDSSPLFLGFFLIYGQRCCFQRRILSSSRSSARPTGRWQLHPSCRKSARPARGGTSSRIPARSDELRATRSTGRFRTQGPAVRVSAHARCVVNLPGVSALYARHVPPASAPAVRLSSAVLPSG